MSVVVSKIFGAILVIAFFAAVNTVALGEARYDPDIKKAQTGLKYLRILKGKPDGYLGPETFRAIQAFQLSRGSDPTGQLTNQQWAELLHYNQLSLERDFSVMNNLLGAIAPAFRYSDEPAVGRMFDGFTTLFNTSAEFSRIQAADRQLFYQTIANSIRYSQPAEVFLPSSRETVTIVPTSSFEVADEKCADLKFSGDNQYWQSSRGTYCVNDADQVRRA